MKKDKEIKVLLPILHKWGKGGGFYYGCDAKISFSIKRGSFIFGPYPPSNPKWSASHLISVICGIIGKKNRQED